MWKERVEEYLEDWVKGSMDEISSVKSIISKALSEAKDPKEFLDLVRRYAKSDVCWGSSAVTLAELMVRDLGWAVS